jgi:hypothetical protein
MLPPRPVLFDTDTWIVLTRTPRAFGPFSSRKKAKLFAACRGGIALTWHEPQWVCEGCPPDFGAVWFNNDWMAPFIVGPFYDREDVIKSYGVDDGIAVALEMPDDYGGDGDGEPIIEFTVNVNDDTGRQKRAA